MTDKQINRWLRRRFSPIGWLLLAFYGVMTLLASVTIVTDAAAQSLWAFAAGDYSGSVNWDAINANAWGYIVALLVGFAILDAWTGPDFRKQELFARQAPMTGAAFGCLLLLCMGAQMLNSFWISFLEMLMNAGGSSLMPILEQVAGDSDSFSMFLYASILAPVWEELLFRGYILRTLKPYGKRFAILASAILFGLFHGNLLQAPYAIAVGLVLGYVAVEYSITWSVLLHMFNNLVLADLLTRLTASWPDLAYNLVHYLLFGGAAVASLVIFWRSRSAIRAYRQREWIDRRCVKCFFTSGGILGMLILMCINMLSILFV